MLRKFIKSPESPDKHARRAKVEAAIGAVSAVGAVAVGYFAYRTGTDMGGVALAPLEFGAAVIVTTLLSTNAIIAAADSNHAAELANAGHTQNVQHTEAQCMGAAMVDLSKI